GRGAAPEQPRPPLLAFGGRAGYGSPPVRFPPGPPYGGRGPARSAGQGGEDQEAQRAEGGGRPAVPYPRGRGGRATGRGRDARIGIAIGPPPYPPRSGCPGRRPRRHGLRGIRESECLWAREIAVTTTPLGPLSLDLSPRLVGLFVTASRPCVFVLRGNFMQEDPIYD
ncbi:hypothetical protein THAOC_06375, partial [Thalassiosira oceanica]